jgi:murein DD-endopeptidase MepM/ murein hydrolase activator NlpD
VSRLVAVVGLVLALSLGAAASADALSLRRPAFGPVTSDFGARSGRHHDGVDFGNLRKLGILASARGKVVGTGYMAGYSGYGKIVLIAHRGGFVTLYAHLSRVRVRRGQWVRAGAWIGTAGRTGSATAVHLHFELRRFGRALDPMRYLRR